MTSVLRSWSSSRATDTADPFESRECESEDERIIVIPDDVFVALDDAHGLEVALQAGLQRKVLIIGDSPWMVRGRRAALSGCGDERRSG
jgi:hypothetical protein